MVDINRIYQETYNEAMGTALKQPKVGRESTAVSSPAAKPTEPSKSPTQANEVSAANAKGLKATEQTRPPIEPINVGADLPESSAGDLLEMDRALDDLKKYGFSAQERKDFSELYKKKSAGDLKRLVPPYPRNAANPEDQGKIDQDRANFAARTRSQLNWDKSGVAERLGPKGYNFSPGEIKYLQKTLGGKSVDQLQNMIPPPDADATKRAQTATQIRQDAGNRAVVLLGSDLHGKISPDAKISQGSSEAMGAQMLRKEKVEVDSGNFSLTDLDSAVGKAEGDIQALPQGAQLEDPKLGALYRETSAQETQRAQKKYLPMWREIDPKTYGGKAGEGAANRRTSLFLVEQGARDPGAIRDWSHRDPTQLKEDLKQFDKNMGPEPKGGQPGNAYYQDVVKRAGSEFSDNNVALTPQELRQVRMSEIQAKNQEVRAKAAEERQDTRAKAAEERQDTRAKATEERQYARAIATERRQRADALGMAAVNQANSKELAGLNFALNLVSQIVSQMFQGIIQMLQIQQQQTGQLAQAGDPRQVYLSSLYRQQQQPRR